MPQATIKIEVTLTNSEGFTSNDTVEDAYLVDPPSNELEAEVRRITGGFRTMMEVIRTTTAQPAAAAPPRQSFRRKLRLIPSRKTEK